MNDQPTLQDTVDAAQDFLKMATAARDSGTMPGPEQASDLIDVGNDLLGAVAHLSEQLARSAAAGKQLALIARSGKAQLEAVQAELSSLKEDLAVAIDEAGSIDCNYDRLSDIEKKWKLNEAETTP